MPRHEAPSELGLYDQISETARKYPENPEELGDEELVYWQNEIVQEKLATVNLLEVYNEYWEENLGSVRIDSGERNKYIDQQDPEVAKMLLFVIGEWTFLSELDRRLITILRIYKAELRNRNLQEDQTLR